MALALEVGVSPRHMSFVETGRSRPSRSLLVRIADTLEIPAREQNALFEATGYARRFPESRLAEPDLAPVRKALRFMLDRHEPNSALVFDGAWDIVMTNASHERLLDRLLPASDADPSVRGNLLRLSFHPAGLRSRIRNWNVVAPVLLRRVERELAAVPGFVRLRDLIGEIRSYGPVPSCGSRPSFRPMPRASGS